MGEPVFRYKPLLDQMRSFAQTNLDILERASGRCPMGQCDASIQRKIPEAQKRARRGERIALNNIAYGVAQDLAARIKTAEPFEATGIEYARKLAGAVERGEIADETERDAVRDTIAFVSLVIEARKPSRDMAEIKKAVGIFEEIIAHQEESLSKNVITTRRERAVLNGSRAHLSSALELLGKVAVKACLNSGVAVCVP